MSRFRRVLRRGLVAFLGAAVLGVLGLGLLWFLIAPKLPDVDQLRNVELQEPLYVYARDGRLMALFGETRRYPIEIEKVPPRLKQAFIAIEDARFYQHHGVDYKGVARAVWLIATTDAKRVPGGSTITQQVARQFFLSSEYSYTRKLAEMMLAMRMENELTKDEIFELYLNKSFFGNRAYGVAAAAEFYYGKSLDQLSLDEMATLASIPKFPSSGNPITNPERAKLRRDYVLERMADLKFISPAEANASAAVAMHATPHERPIEVYAPYVAEMVRQEMVARFGGDVLTKGYHVTTTIDPALQAAADQAVRDGLRTYDHRHGWHGVEKQVELQAGDTPETIRGHLRGIVMQGGLMPAIVTGESDNTATVMLSDGTQVDLGSDASEWTGRSPASLLARGDIVRVRIDMPKPAVGKDGKPVAAEAVDATPKYKLDQLPRAQSALISLEANTGALRALVGGFSFAGQKFNRATQARRQPGSSFKPFLYAAAFERGFNPASIVLDAPVVFRDRVGHIWRPQNDTGNFAGPMRLREALVQSRNLVSVRLLDAIGVDYARKYISHFGFPIDHLVPNLSMSLGASSLQPLAVARGYAAFANGGFLVTPWYVDEVKDRNGKVIFKEKPKVACPGCGMRNGQLVSSTVVDGFDLGNTPAPAPANAATVAKPVEPAKVPEGSELAPRAIDERVAYQLQSMMRDVVQRGTGTAAKVLERPDVGGKTGSTNDHRDAWFSGFGGGVATTVWVGRDDYKSLGYREYGGKAALPIWIDYMRVALDGRPVMANDPPQGMVEVAVGAGGHLVANGTGGITEWVKTEDLERMETYVDYGPEDAAPSEDTYDIF
ncbi:penicillin-binding protein 1A [Lysobacter sp. A6]|uniref:Penicillin-binding protein 1A n=1 Tax=Noviluteimonas lactosilytica TaxID=2888523 RepID=A0ABS8JKM8_9GAMM|nr:penicillin-binding protein 1A [Lysobacter lactosilyticus]MCC8364158.1 penicillin-binding protein 1A [Lysobacter lactosilyticus]